MVQCNSPTPSIYSGVIVCLSVSLIVSLNVRGEGGSFNKREYKYGSLGGLIVINNKNLFIPSRGKSLHTNSQSIENNRTNILNDTERNE